MKLESKEAFPTSFTFVVSAIVSAQKLSYRHLHPAECLLGHTANSRGYESSSARRTVLLGV